MRPQSAAGSQRDFLLEAAVGRQHRCEAAFWSLELVKHLRGHSHVCRMESWSHIAADTRFMNERLTSVHLMDRPSDSESVSCSTRTLLTPSSGLPSTPLVLLQRNAE